MQQRRSVLDLRTKRAAFISAGFAVFLTALLVPTINWAAHHTGLFLHFDEDTGEACPFGQKVILASIPTVFLGTLLGHLDFLVATGRGKLGDAIFSGLKMAFFFCICGGFLGTLISLPLTLLVGLIAALIGFFLKLPEAYTDILLIFSSIFSVFLFAFHQGQRPDNFYEWDKLKDEGVEILNDQPKVKKATTEVVN